MARRRGGISDFLTNFNAAYGIGNTIGGNIERGRVMDAQPEQFQGYTQEQGDQLNAAAASGQYDVTFDDASQGYKVTPRADPSMSGMVTPQARTSFLGNTHDGALGAGRVDQLRSHALADIETRRTGAAEGLKLRDVADTRYRQAVAADREDQKFQDAEDLKLKAAGYVRHLQSMPMEDLVSYANGLLGPTGYGDLTFDSATGAAVFRPQVEGLPGGAASRGDIMSVLYQGFLAGEGDHARGFTTVVKGYNDVRDRATAQAKTAKGFENIDSQITDREERRKLTERHQNDTSYLRAVDIGRRAGQAQQPSAGQKIAAPKFTDIDRDTLRQIDGEAARLTRQLDGGMLPPSEAAAAQAQITALQGRRSQLVQGVRDRPLVETMLPIIQQQLRNNVPPAQLLAFARERGFPDSAIATAFAQAGVDMSSLEAPAPRQGVTLPSDRRAAAPKPAPAPKPGPAPAAPAPKPAPKGFYGEEAGKERAAAAQRRKEEQTKRDVEAAQRRKEEAAKREADAAAKRRQIYDRFNELYGKK